MELPDYVNCKNQEFEQCDFILVEECPSTCAYAVDIGGIGLDQSPRRDITNNLNKTEEKKHGNNWTIS